MTRETKVAQIPDVRDDNVTEVLRAIKNVLQVREGHIGDALDQNVTVRDLKDLGVVQGGGFTFLSNGSRVPVLITGKLPDGYDPATDYATPPVPTGLVATGGFSNVYLSWNGAPYKNPAYTEIWRASVDNLGDAVRIGTTATNVYADAALEGETYYYWIRFVSVANVTGPYNDTEGTPATTAINPGPVLDLLSGQITESQLYSTLGSRINLIDASSSVTNSVAWRVAQEASARAQDLLTEAAARATGDSALQTQINTIVAAGSSDTATILAALQSEQTARINADSAEVTARETLASQVRGSYTGTDIAQVSTGLIYNERQARTTADTALSTSISALSSTVTNNYNTLNSAIVTEQTTRASADTALSTSITNLSSTVTGNYNTLSALIQTEQTTRANADSAFSSSITTLQASVNSNTAAIQTEQSVRAAADNSLYAQYTVKIDNNGHVSGFGLASTNSTAGPTSAFIVRADRFAIAGPNDTTDPLGTTSPSRLPFIVTTTPTTINGRTYPTGTWIDTAFIANATIGSAQIGSLTADKITAGNLTAAIGITTGYLAGGVSPGSYSPGAPLFGTGFYLGLDSSVFKFYVGSYSKNILWDGTNLAIKGTISASSATFQGLTITDNSGNILLSSGGVPASIVTGLGSLATANSVSTGQVTGLGALATQNTVSSGQVTGLGALATQNTVSTGQVTGLGGLATQNSVFFGSTVKFPDGSTANTGDFVNRLSQINAGNVSTFIASGAIGEAYIGNLSAGKITSGFISADRIQAGSLDAKIANIDAAVIGSGTIANARIGDLYAKKIYCGTTTNAVDFVDPGQTSIPLNSTATGWFSYTGDTAATTYVPQTCEGESGTYDCSYYTYGASPVTSQSVQFVCGDAGVPRERRVRSGVVRFHVMASATAEHYFSIWARGGTVNNPGGWFPLVLALEPQNGYGATSVSCYFDVNMGYGYMIQFAMHATDLSGNYWNSGYRELRYANMTVIGVNF